MICFYLEASEEAATFDADAPLEIEVTPAGRAIIFPSAGGDLRLFTRG
ncbi:MAG TPA: hypothetical protein VKT32_10925 [Chthonomonadaceae bacterium]|nr:hypothetical protein [Chthonomonadaceae bacterium]